MFAGKGGLLTGEARFGKILTETIRCNGRRDAFQGRIRSHDEIDNN